MKAINLFLLIILFFFIACDDKNKSNDMIEVSIYKKNEYQNCIDKIKFIENKKDRQFVIGNAQKLLIELKSDFEKLMSNSNYLSLYKGKLIDEYEFTEEVLKSIIDGNFEFTGDKYEYTNYDIWREYFVKYNSSYVFHDWFVFYNPVRINISENSFEEDYFVNPLENNFKYNPEISYNKIIGKFYFQYKDLSLKKNSIMLTNLEMQKYFDQEMKDNDKLVFWCFDE